MDPIEYLFCPRCVFFGVMFDSFQKVSSPCWRISLPFFQPSIFAYLSCILQEHLKQEWCLNIIASWKKFPFFSCALICVCCRLSIFVQIFCTQKITSYNQHTSLQQHGFERFFLNQKSSTPKNHVAEVPLFIGQNFSTPTTTTPKKITKSWKGDEFFTKQNISHPSLCLHFIDIEHKDHLKQTSCS